MEDGNGGDASALVLRAARRAEAASLSALALRSKAHWGYPPEFMAACRAELTVTPERISQGRTWVAERGGRVLGLCAWDAGPPAELELMFVEPGAMGTGVGRALLRHVLAAAAAAGVAALRVASDPGASGFYRRMGARAAGEIPSGSIPGRMLPCFELPTGAGGG